MTPHDWNTDVEALENGRRRWQIGVGPRNYLKANQPWQRINNSIQNDFTVTAFPASIQFPATSQGQTLVEFDSAHSMRRKLSNAIDANPEPAFELEISANSQHNVTGEIDENDPSQIVYANAWDSADLILRAARGRTARLEKLVRIHSAPSGNSQFVDYEFILRSPHAKLWTGSGRTNRPWNGLAGESAEVNNTGAFIARQDSTIRGAILETPTCWYTKADGTVVRQPVRVVLQVMVDMTKVRATKRIPRSMITAALAEGVPLYTDATFKTDDAGCTDHVAWWTGNDTIANARAGSGVSWSDHYSGYENVWWISSSTTTNQYDRLQRGFVFLDTSSASGAVTEGDVEFYQYGASDNFTISSSTGLYQTTSTGTTTGAASDFETGTTTALTDTPFAWPGSAGWNSLPLNAAGLAEIDVDGYSRFCGASVKDLGEESITWVSGKDAYWQARMEEYAGDFGPRLNLTTEEPTGLLQATNNYFLRSN